MLASTDSNAVSSAVIDSDIVCIGCGYNLRTQPLASACPECGRSVLESRDAYVLHHSELGPLRASGLPWLRAMHQGLMIAWIAWLLTLSGAIYGLTDSEMPPDSRDGSVYVWLTPLVTVYVLSYAAAWRLMTPRHRSLQLRLARVVLVTGLSAIGLVFINYRWAMFYRHAFERFLWLPSEGFIQNAQRVGGYASFTWPIISALTFGRLVQLAWISKRRTLAVLLGLIGLIPAGVLALVCATFPYPIFESSQVIFGLPGPTATMPLLPAAVFFMTMRYPIEMLVATVFLMIYIMFGLMLNSLRGTISRAILLSEVSAASSRSSPSPHPEVQSH